MYHGKSAYNLTFAEYDSQREHSQLDTWSLLSLAPFVVKGVTVISLLLSTSVRVLLSPSIERRETRPTAQRPCPRTLWTKKVAQSQTLDQAGDWTRDLLVGS